MICRLSANSSNSVADLRALDVPAVMTLAEEINERDERMSWENLHEILARIFDLLAIMRVEQLACAGVPRSKVPKPSFMPRPGEETEPEIRVVSPGEAVRLMIAS